VTLMSLIIKNRIRLTLDLLKNYWYFFAATVLGFLFIAESVVERINMVPVDDLMLYTSILIILLSFRKIISGRYPVIRMSPASIHFFRGSPLFTKLFHIKVFLSLAGCIATGAVIATITYRAAISKELFIYSSVTALYLFLNSLIAWIYYNSQSVSQKIYVVAIFLFISGLLIYNTVISLYILTVLTVFAAIRAYRTKILWNKYYRDCSFIYENMAAAAKKDMVRMMETVNKLNLSKKPVFHSIFSRTPPSKKTALIMKSFLGVVRTNIQTVKFLFIIFAAGIILNNFVFMTPGLNRFLSAIALGSFYANLAELFRKQIVSIIDKKKRGFYIPYTDIEILLSYSVLPTIIFLIASSMLIFFTDIDFYSVLLSGVLYCTFYIITGFVSVRIYAKQMLVWRVSNIIYFVISILCFALIA
jgi:hypothetical protein